MATRNLRIVLLVVAMMALGTATPACNRPLQAQPAFSPQQHGLASTEPSHEAMQMGSIPHAASAISLADLSKHPWCEDIQWSTFNHRVAGWFLLFWGLAAFIAGLQWPHRTWWRFVPPMLLFGLAEFLFFRNDPETWPVGPVTLWASLHDAEDLQHRIFLVLLILIGVVELLRAADRLPDLLKKYALPVLGTFGAVYLFFHEHGGEGMATHMIHDPSAVANPAVQQMMASMKTVVHEHMWISIFGFGLAAAKLLADTGRFRGRWGATLWPVFAILLGIYMTGYVE